VQVESLSKVKHLELNSLTSITDQQTESLSKNKGTLSLYGLTVLSDTAADHLAKHPDLTINLDNLPESAAQILRDAGHG